MSDKKTVISDKMIEAELKEKSKILNISLDGLIDRYIRRGIFYDKFYIQPDWTREEIIEMCKKGVEEDKKRGIYPKIISTFLLASTTNMIKIGEFP